MRLAAILTWLAAAIAPGHAHAQNITASLTNAPALQEIVTGTAQTTFSVSEAGVVSQTPTGTTAAVRVKSGATTALTLTVVCARGAVGNTGKDCAGESITIRLLEGTAVGGGNISAFTCLTGQTQPTGVTYTCATNNSTGAASRDFVIAFGSTAAAAGWTSTIKVGVGLIVPANATRGSTSVPVACTSTASGLDSYSGTGCGTAITGKILRPMAVAKSSDLSFGKIVRPASGTGTVSVSAAGTRTASGNAAAVAASAATRAAFTITAEGGQAIAVTVPASFVMTNGANSLTVTTSNNLPGGTSAQTLGGTIGSDGSLAVGVGGSITLSATTVPGDYTGSLTVTASYQ